MQCNLGRNSFHEHHMSKSKQDGEARTLPDKPMMT